MMILFFGGVMNLVWIAVITASVLLEKIIARGDLAGKITGVALIAFGLSILSL